MAIKRVFQREIIEVPFSLPDGQILVHPALVLSSEELQDYEDAFTIFQQKLSFYDRPQLDRVKRRTMMQRLKKSSV